MKITCFSDTHRHRPELGKGDMLIFAGDDDITDIKTLINFTQYIKKQDFKYKIMIGGNHDFFIKNLFAKEYLIENNIIYLEDQMIEIEGIKIYGTPYTPQFMNWAFMESEDMLLKRYSLIPKDVNILVSHGPAYGVRDQIVYGNSPSIKSGKFLGSKALAEVLPSLIDLKYHIFGHIHGSYGTTHSSINCSICDERYNMANEPIELCLFTEVK